MPDRPCAECGVMFTPVKGTSRYCSPECWRVVKRRRDREGPAGRRRAVLPNRDCGYCGQRFKALRGSQRFCSQSCSSRSRDASGPASAIFVINCRWCERDAVVRRPDAFYCSKQCWHDSQRHAIHVRRASVTAGDRFTARYIYERDGWRCHLCGRKVKPTKRAPHPDSPVLDHVVPLARGGAHARENVRCAHWGCNSRKGARCVVQGEQLLLVG